MEASLSKQCHNPVDAAESDSISIVENFVLCDAIPWSMEDNKTLKELPTVNSPVITLHYIIHVILRHNSKDIITQRTYKTVAHPSCI